jgi:hypothetical protein
MKTAASLTFVSIAIVAVGGIALSLQAAPERGYQLVNTAADVEHRIIERGMTMERCLQRREVYQIVHMPDAKSVTCE